MSLRVIARLLEYPDERLGLQRDQLLVALESTAELDLTQSGRLIAFIYHYTSLDLATRQAEYQQLLARGKPASLMLLDHCYCQDAGLMQPLREGEQVHCGQLPCFLPRYLSLLASCSDSEAYQGLQDIAPILRLLAQRLHQQNSEYATLFEMLLVLAQQRANPHKSASQPRHLSIPDHF